MSSALRPATCSYKDFSFSRTKPKGRVCEGGRAALGALK